MVTVKWFLGIGLRSVCRAWGQEGDSGRLFRGVLREVVTRREWFKAGIWT